MLIELPYMTTKDSSKSGKWKMTFWQFLPEFKSWTVNLILNLV